MFKNPPKKTNAISRVCKLGTIYKLHRNFPFNIQSVLLRNICLSFSLNRTCFNYLPIKHWVVKCNICQHLIVSLDLARDNLSS